MRRKLVKEEANMPMMRDALRSGQGEPCHYEPIKRLRIQMQYRWLQPSFQVRVGERTHLNALDAQAQVYPKLPKLRNFRRALRNERPPLKQLLAGKSYLR